DWRGRSSVRKSSWFVEVDRSRTLSRFLDDDANPSRLGSKEGRGRWRTLEARSRSASSMGARKRGNTAIYGIAQIGETGGSTATFGPCHSRGNSGTSQ